MLKLITAIFIASSFLIACSDAKVSVSGLKAIGGIQATAPPYFQVGGSRSTLVNGANAMTVQVSGKGQQILANGGYTLVVEVVR